MIDQFAYFFGPIAASPQAEAGAKTCGCGPDCRCGDACACGPQGKCAPACTCAD